MVADVSIDFNNYVRVSEVLNRLRDRSGINPVVLEEKGRIGTEVHQNIYELETEGMPFFDLFPMRDRAGLIKATVEGKEHWERRGVGYYNSYVAWKKDQECSYFLHPNPISKVEGRFYDDVLMITGQIDALINMPSKELPVLTDFKCSYSADLEIWEMQAHFYYYLLEINGIKVHPEFCWLQLKKDGKSPKEHWMKFDEKTLQTCLREAELYWEEKKHAKAIDL